MVTFINPTNANPAVPYDQDATPFGHLTQISLPRPNWDGVTLDAALNDLAYYEGMCERVADEMPSTYYADLSLDQRVAKLVAAWQKLVRYFDVDDNGDFIEYPEPDDQSGWPCVDPECIMCNPPKDNEVITLLEFQRRTKRTLKSRLFGSPEEPHAS